MNSFYSEEELKKINKEFLNKNILISKKTSFYGSNISIGKNVRIDDFCILSGNIEIGSNVHIAAYSSMYAGDSKIIINDFVNISSRVAIYAISDDYSGESMTSPVIPERYKKVQKNEVAIQKHAILGTGTTILPGSIISEGVAIGAMSLINFITDPWNIYVGIPAKKIKKRKKDVLKLEVEYLESIKENE